MQKKTPSAYIFVQTATEQIAKSLTKHINTQTDPAERSEIVKIFGLSALPVIDDTAVQQYITQAIDTPIQKVPRKRLSPGEQRSPLRGRPKKVSLDARDVLVLHLRFIGKTYAQIASVFGWSRQAVHTRHLRATNLVCTLAVGRVALIEATPILNYISLNKKPKR